MVDLTAVKEYLRIDGNAEDEYLNILVLLSAEICANYLRLETLPNNQSVRQAQLLIAGYFYENREGTRDGIPAAVFTLLNPDRKAAF